MTELSFVPTEELEKEILARADHAVIAYMRRGEGGDGKVSYSRKLKGNRVTCMGLAMDIIGFIQERLNQERRPVQ